MQVVVVCMQQVVLMYTGIYIRMCVSLLVLVCPVCVRLCVWYQIRVLAKTMLFISGLQ